MSLIRSVDFPPIPSYPKKGGTPVDEVEAWLDEHPEKRVENQTNNGSAAKDDGLPPFMMRHPLRTFTDADEIKKARANAKKEYKKALQSVNATHNCHRCTKCGVVKPLDDAHFYRNGQKKLMTRCIECSKQYSREYWRAKNKQANKKP